VLSEPRGSNGNYGLIFPASGQWELGSAIHNDNTYASLDITLFSATDRDIGVQRISFMSHKKLRRRIAHEAARLICGAEKPRYERAKREAARQLGSGRMRAADLPSNREVREEIEALAEFRRTVLLDRMRCEALRVMRILHNFRPQLRGATLTGNVSADSTIELAVCSENHVAVLAVLAGEGAVHHVGYRQLRKNGQSQRVACLRLQGEFPFMLLVVDADPLACSAKDLPDDDLNHPATIEVLEQLLAETDKTGSAVPTQRAEHKADRFEIYGMLLGPLEAVMQNPEKHPEGDALYHSLQVFARAQDQLPYDEEFLLAALLHDVGKAIDPEDHVAAALTALGGWITERTAWLMEHHLEGRAYLHQKLGARARRRLQAASEFEELLVLAECDLAGRQRGAEVPDVEEAFAYIRELADSLDE
jgi:hypothetical protein